jgi:predicted N-acetyltransferase YhbS
MLFELYRTMMDGSDAHTMIGGPLPSNPTPHLDTVYSAVSNASDIPGAFAAQYRHELGGRSDRPLPLISIAGKSALVGAFIREGYPPSMQHFADEATIAENLRNPTANTYSFVALGQDGNKAPEYQAVCTSYVTDSKVAPGERTVLYIDDLVVSPSGQSNKLGVLAFREVLTRAAAQGEETIEMRARHRTSYKGFRGSVMARILESMGYKSTDHGVVVQYGAGEETEQSHLIEVTRLSPKE